MNEEMNLTEKEEKRLDDLLISCRNLHYINFIVAALSLALSSLETDAAISLPITGISLPKINAAVGFYLVTIAIGLANVRLFKMAWPWLALDARRPSFAWIGLGVSRPSHLAVLLWISMPMYLAAIASAIVLGQDFGGMALAFIGTFLIFTPLIFGSYMVHIKNRTDERGGPATLSIWLLYWTRLLRHILVCLFFFLPVLAIVPPWRGSMLLVIKYLTAPLLIVFLARIFGSFTYKIIDKIGSKFGFPSESPHYPKKLNAQ